MRIRATCPHCQSEYTLEESLRGKRMRCPNTICRAVFEVRDADAPAASPEAPVAPVVVPAPPAPDWQMAPPPVRSEPQKELPLVVEIPPPKAEEPIREPAATTLSWDSAPPPVRRPGSVAEIAPVAATTESAISRAFVPEPPATPSPKPQRRRRPYLWIGGMFALLAVIASVGAVQIIRRQAEQETTLVTKAKEAYARADYVEARQLLQKLQAEYPTSSDLPNYRFLAALSDLRASVEDGNGDQGRTLDDVLEFLAINQGDARLKEHGPDLWRMLHRLAKDLASQAEEKKDAGSLALAQKAWREATRLPVPQGTALGETDQKLKAAFERAERTLVEKAKREAVRDRAERYARQATLASIRDLRALLTKEKLTNEGDFAPLLAEAAKRHRERLTYVAAEPTYPMPPEGLDHPLAWAPAIGKPEATGVEGPPFLALTQGVLYALDPGDGHLRWAVRLGPDPAGQPIRVPADIASPRLVLVASSDRRSMLALEEATGAVLWETKIEQTPIAQPLLWNRRLFVPTNGGRIEELEIALGRRLGAFQFDQNTPWGGTLLPGSSLAVFPGRAHGMYVVDLETHKVEGVIDSGHATGALRGPPISVVEDAGSAKGPRGWVVVAEQTGDHRIALKPFAVPPGSAPSPDLRLSATIDVSDAPWTDGDKLALVSDAGQLALFGLRLKGNNDPLVFPWIKEIFPLELSLSPRHRAAVVHGDRDRFWISTQGKLHRVDHVVSPQNGPSLVTRWSQSATLGSPVQPGEIRRTEDGKSILFVLTQDADRPLRIASAVDAETGKILWRRHLGITPMQRPIAVAGSLAVLDPGGIFVWNQENLKKRDAAPAHAIPRLAPASHEVHLLPLGEGMLEISSPAKAKKDDAIEWRKIGFDGTASELAKSRLPVGIAGVPVAGSNFFILPLTDGRLLRIALDSAVTISGPEWRTLGTEPSAVCRLTALGKDQFLVSDGGREVFWLDWSEAKDAKRRGDYHLSRRLAAEPLLLPGQRLLLADRGGDLVLTEGDRILPKRTWKIDGLPTAGPYAAGSDFALIVDRKRLVWMDAERDPARWQRDFDAELAGGPLRMGADIIVADLAGRVWRLDPQTGDPRDDRPAFVSRSAAAPAVGPIPLDGQRILLILDDGTGRVVSLGK
ncbi:MAG: PQQ-binding-like beta-propeller repeat protein [Gemmataceae bacterium]|nr:PQQ-binding-like beta-propeller repeat protein [Gemmataceae bacterium]